MSTVFMVSVLVSTLFSACADVSEIEDQASNDKSFASDSLYTCQVATIAPDGSQWSYHTGPFGPSSDYVEISVYKDNERYGPLYLDRVDQGVFSDQNVSVKLVTVDGKNSIAVQHNQVSLFARAENGWCQASASANHTPRIGGYDTFKVNTNEACTELCSFSVETNMNVSMITYEVDGWYIGENTEVHNNFAISYTFNTQGSRQVKATGYDASGNFVASDYADFYINAGPINQNDHTGSTTHNGVQLNVPYFYQYHNAQYKSNSCQNTSIAMVLSYYKADIHPNVINQRFGKDMAQTVDGLNYVFNTLATEYGTPQIDSYPLGNAPAGTMDQAKAALDLGKPVIIHGFFTGSGHVVVLTGYNENGYYINDPAGTWNGKFGRFGMGGGYEDAWYENTEGKGIFHSKSNFELAVGSLDGSYVD